MVAINSSYDLIEPIYRIAFSEIWEIKAMKRLIATVIIQTGLIASTVQAAEYNSQTFFMPRPLGSIAELALQNYKMYHNNYDENRKAYKYPQDRALLSNQNNYVYFETGNSQAMARYFLQTRQSHIDVDQNGGDNKIASKWLGLDGPTQNFKSKLGINPSRRVYGTIIGYHHDLSIITKNLWWSFSLPILRVEHKLKISEFDQGEQGADTRIKTVIDALNQSDYQYGKFNPNRMAKVGLDDLSIKAGYNINNEDNVRFGVYGNIIVPLGDKPNSEFVFGHMLGNGGHTGIGCGVNLESLLYEEEKHELSMIADLNYKYLLPAVEKRSFDLVNGKWSRYLFVVREGAALNPLSGINFFTKDLVVKPESSADLMCALHYRHSNLNVEAGYNLWIRAEENVKLKNDWNENIGVFNPQALSNSDGTASSADITQSFTEVIPDGQFIKIGQEDIDLLSATHKEAMTQSLYVGMSLDTSLLDSPVMIGLGGSYELASDNTAFNTWGVWAKTSISF